MTEVLTSVLVVWSYGWVALSFISAPIAQDPARVPTRFTFDPPATNLLPLTQVVLEGIQLTEDRTYPGFRFKALDAPPVNWMGWETIITDASGKQIKSEPGGRVDLPGRLDTDQSWNISLRSTEYIAGERIKWPDDATARALDVSQRAQAYGVQKVIFLGQGSYMLKDGDISTVPTPAVEEELTLLPDGSLLVRASEPAALLVLERQSSALRLSVRLRERPKGGRGDPVWPRAPKYLRAEISGGTQEFQLHRFDATNGKELDGMPLEVEIVVRLPIVNWIVDLPNNKAVAAPPPASTL